MGFAVGRTFHLTKNVALCYRRTKNKNAAPFMLTYLKCSSLLLSTTLTLPPNACNTKHETEQY